MFDICIVDDDIPIQRIDSYDTRSEINSSVLKMLLRDHEEAWEEKIRMLIESVVSDEVNWKVTAFRDPNAYLKSVEENRFRSEILVFDWDYNPVIDDMPAILKKIVMKSFVCVYIYSHVDKLFEVNNLIESSEFSEFKNRIFVISKLLPDSHLRVLSDATIFQTDNFSFRLGKYLRTCSMEALEDVLIELGKLDFKKVLEILKVDIDDETHGETELIMTMADKLKAILTTDTRIGEMCGLDSVKSEELVNIIGERLKDVLSAAGLGSLKPDERNHTTVLAEQRTPNDTGANNGTGLIELRVAQKLWSYRLYSKHKDKRVRKGDIIFSKGVSGKIEDFKHGYLVVTAACDLERFWEKNHGNLCVVPIYRVENIDEYDKKRLMQGTKKTTGVSGNSIIKVRAGIMILPYLEVEDEMHTYVFNPNMVQYLYYSPPTDSGSGSISNPLTYDELSSHVRHMTLSEPFLAPFIREILNTIDGSGTPDYSKKIADNIESSVKSLLQ